MYLDKEAYERAGIVGKPHGVKGKRGLKPRWSRCSPLLSSAPFYILTYLFSRRVRSHEPLNVPREERIREAGLRSQDCVQHTRHMALL